MIIWTLITWEFYVRSIDDTWWQEKIFLLKFYEMKWIQMKINNKWSLENIEDSSFDDIMNI